MGFVVDFYRVEARALHTSRSAASRGSVWKRPHNQFLDPSVGLVPTYCTLSHPLVPFLLVRLVPCDLTIRLTRAQASGPLPNVPPIYNSKRDKSQTLACSIILTCSTSLSLLTTCLTYLHLQLHCLELVSTIDCK
jgi:hypothetical protein